MINTIVKTTFISTLLLVSTSAFPFGLSDLSGSGDKKSSSADSYAAQDGLVKQYNKAAKNVAVAQQMFANALGLKKEAAAIGAEAEALESGAVVDQDSMERISETSGSVNKAILTEVENSKGLSTKAKKEFAKAFVPYFVGLVETSKISDAAADFIEGATDTISSASFTDKLSVTKKLSPGMYVAREVPGFGVSLYDSSKTLIAFAESQGIDVPDDVLDEVSFN
jgi:hypothetical protein